MKDYYQIIGVTNHASLETIKSTFRKKVVILHPEKNRSTNAKEEFGNLIEAYAILSKPEKRKAYDAITQQRQENLLVPVLQETEETFETYQKEAKSTSKKYRESTFAELLALDLIVDLGIDSLFIGGSILDNSGDLLGEAGDIAGDLLGDIFDIF